MKAKNTRPFELKLGKLAIILTISGVSILIFLSFLFGVHVGMNIETYPGEIAWGIPAKVVRFLGIPKSPGKIDVPPIIPAPSIPPEVEKEIPREPQAPAVSESPPVPIEPVKSAISPGGEAGKLIPEAPPAPGRPVASEEAAKPAEPPTAKEGKAPMEGIFIVQVGSFRDEKKAKEVSAKLKSMGFHTRLRKLDLAGKGRWHQVTIEKFSSKAEAEKVVEKVTSQIKGLDCVIRRVDKGH